MYPRCVYGKRAERLLDALRAKVAAVKRSSDHPAQGLIFSIPAFDPARDRLEIRDAGVWIVN